MKKLTLILSLVMIAGICISAPRKARRRLLLAASGFSPLDTADCALWLDADDYSTFTLDGTNITTWANKVTTEADATQTRSTAKPIYLADQQGGKPAVYFDGGDYLSTGYHSIDGQTVFLIANSIVIVKYILGARDSEDTRSYIGTLTDHITCGVGSVYNIYNSSYDWDGVYHYVSVDYDGSTVNIYDGGTLAETREQLGTGANPIQSYYIGTFNNKGSPSVYFKGWISEVIIYKKVLTTVERQDVEVYLADKYSL